MSKKRIGIAVMALGMFLWAAAAYASAPPPAFSPMALPVPSGFLKVLLLLTFLCIWCWSTCSWVPVILSVIDRRASASDRKGGWPSCPRCWPLP